MHGGSTVPRQFLPRVYLRLVLAAWLAGCATDSGATAAKPAQAQGSDSVGVDAVDAVDVLLAADTAATDAQPVADAVTSADAVADAVMDAVAATAADALVDSAVGSDAVIETAIDATADATVVYAAPSTGGEFAVELGGSSADGASIQAWTTPGQSAALVFGPQGGYHIWVSFCGPEALGTKAGVKIQAALPDGTQVDPGTTELTSKLVAVVGKSGQVCRIAAPAFVTCACELDGVPLRIRVEVTDLSGGSGSIAAKQGWAEKTVVPKHESGPCWAKGNAPCAGRRGNN